MRWRVKNTMAGIGHIAVAVATARWRSRGQPMGPLVGKMALFSALAMLPDIDVIAFLFKIPYRDQFGHRGAFHSLSFAFMVGMAIALIQHLREEAVFPSAIIGGGLVASHGILDALTSGGLGVALLWPWSEHRYFFPWHPIPVSPIGFEVLTKTGLTVAAVELCLFAPLLVYALWPRRRLVSRREET